MWRLLGEVEWSGHLLGGLGCGLGSVGLRQDHLGRGWLDRLLDQLLHLGGQYLRLGLGLALDLAEEHGLWLLLRQ